MTMECWSSRPLAPSCVMLVASVVSFRLASVSPSSTGGTAFLLVGSDAAGCRVVVQVFVDLFVLNHLSSAVEADSFVPKETTHLGAFFAATGTGGDTP